MAKTFTEFIENLSEEDLKNFKRYSPVRGKIIYRLIFNELSKSGEFFTYTDLNCILRYDKALKDCLFKYIGALEETLKTYIFSNYDLKCTNISGNKSNEEKQPYRSWEKISNAVEEYDNSSGEITELYKRFALNFGDIIKFLRENKCPYDCVKLGEIKKLRDRVMHHLPLLIHEKEELVANDRENQIGFLKDMLPDQYKHNLIKSIDGLTNKTKEQLDKKFYYLLLKV